MSDDLVARLREPISQMSGSDDDWIARVVVERNAAADRIEALEAECERLREAAKGQLVVVNTAIAERDSYLAMDKAHMHACEVSMLEQKARADAAERALSEAIEVLKPFAKGYWSKQNPKVKVSVIFNHNPFDERELCSVGDIHTAYAFVQRQLLASEGLG